MKQIEFQVIGFWDVPQDGVVWGLLAGFDLAEVDVGVSGGAVQHFAEELLCHEMGTGTGGQIDVYKRQYHVLWAWF